MITDELRKYAALFHNVWTNCDDNVFTFTTADCPPAFDSIRMDAHILAIADRIDAEHQKAEDEWKAKDGQSWLHGYAECHAELMEGNEVISASLEEAGWVRLPKDADREYIHEHDKVDWRDHAGTWHENATVVAVCNDGCYVMDGVVFHVHKSDIRHHHAPTVEDVLYDGLKHFGAVEERTPEVDSWVCEQAAKLREMLAGDAE